MDVSVRYLVEDWIDIPGVATVGELKTALGNHYNFDDHDNFDEWKLFQSGLELDQPEVELKNLTPNREKLDILLVAPPDIERIGRRSRVYKANKNRFLVKHNSKYDTGLEVIQLRSEYEETAQCSDSFHFKKGETFAVLTNIVNDLKKPAEREVEIHIYDVDRDGYIFLWTDDDDLMRLPLEQPYKMFLIPERDAMPRHARELKRRQPGDPQCWAETELKEEGNCTSVHMDWIWQQMAEN